MVLFGTWHRKGVFLDDKGIASPDAYSVYGFNFRYKLRVGALLDGVHDSSANLYTEDYIVGYSLSFVSWAVDTTRATHFTSHRSTNNSP